MRVWALLSALIPRLLTLLVATPFFSGIFVCGPTVCGLASGLFLFGEEKEFKLEGLDEYEPIDEGLFEEGNELLEESDEPFDGV